MRTRLSQKPVLGKLKLAVPISVFLGLWEVVSRIGLVEASLFPPPTKVVVSLVAMLLSGVLIRDILISASRALVGYAMGSVSGISLGLLMGRSRLWSNLLFPIFQMLRPIPPITFVPFAILWFGIGEMSKYLLVFVAVFFTVWMNSYLGALRVEDVYIWAARSLGTKGKTLLAGVIFPAALPMIIAGLRNAVALAFYSLVAAEISGAFSGLAFRIELSHRYTQVDRMMACLIVLGVMSASADWLFRKGLERWAPWYEANAEA